MTDQQKRGDDRPPAHLKVEGGADRDVYCNGERLDKSDAGHRHVELQRELDNGFTAEFTVGYDGTIGVGVELYKFPVPDPVAETELENTAGEPRPTFEGELRGDEFLVEILKRDEPELVTDGGRSESEVEHTLFIVERDDLDDAVPYQVLKAEHPPDSEQTKALEGVMCQLVEQAEAETGERHRLVREVDAPDVVQSHYEAHEERIEGETVVTDGGCVERDAEIVMMYDSGKDWSTIAERFDISVDEAMARYRDEKYNHWDTGWELGPADAQARFETGAIDVWGDGDATVMIEEIVEQIPLTLVAEDDEARTLVQANLTADQAWELADTLAECAKILEGDK